MNIDYLGDGVYVEMEGGMIKLTTENGICVTNTIYLEPDVYMALVDYVKRLTHEAPLKYERST
jgi:endo-beta-N-acetylglucosaminidase D